MPGLNTWCMIRHQTPNCVGDIMKILATLCIAFLFHPHVAYSQADGKSMIKGLTKAYEASCSGVSFEVWYSPQSDTAHMRDENPTDFARDRVVMIVTNSQPPANRRFAFTEPKPLPGYVNLLRKAGGGWVDLSSEQIDSRHTGRASKMNMSFEGVGDVFASTTYYPAFTTIADPQSIERGDYVLRFTVFPYLEVEGQPCPMKLPDLPIRVH